MDASSTGSLSEDALQSIIDRFDDPEVDFPAAAIDEAREHAKEITPHLIRALEKATSDCRAGKLDDSIGHVIVAYLLAEFRAIEAWPALRETLLLPGDKPAEMFGETLTRDFGFIIHTLAGDRIDEVDELFADTSVAYEVRLAACDTIVYRVRDGVLTREDAITLVAERLERAIAHNDKIAESLVMRLEDLGAEHHVSLVEQAYAAGLVNADAYPLNEVLGYVKRGDAVFESTMASLLYPERVLAHLQRWAGFEDEDLDWQFTGELPEGDFEVQTVRFDFDGNPVADNPKPVDSVKEDYVSDNRRTVRKDRSKVGRNDQCPCGSGKKYKKCCGLNSNLEI